MAARVIGTGSAIPKRRVTNQALAQRLGFREDAIERRTGIQTRYWAEEGDTASGLATEAACAALQATGLNAKAVDLLIVSTSSPDFILPATSCLVQRNLGMRPVPAFDLNASCSGFLYALSVADQYLTNRSVQNVLIVCVELKSRFVNPDDPSTAILFGDGAGAVVLSHGVRGLRSLRIHADGAQHHLAYLPAGGSRNPMTKETLSNGLHWMKMDGKRLFRVAVQRMDRVLTELGVPSCDVDRFVFHQANLRILEAVCKKQGIPPWKNHLIIQKAGNTSSASLPMALDDAVRTGKIKAGNLVGLCAFGGGATWGGALIDW